MDEEQREAIGEALAHLIVYTVAWEKRIDGDATKGIANAFLKELDELNGNV